MNPLRTGSKFQINRARSSTGFRLVFGRAAGGLQRRRRRVVMLVGLDFDVCELTNGLAGELMDRSPASADVLLV